MKKNIIIIFYITLGAINIGPVLGQNNLDFREDFRNELIKKFPQKETSSLGVRNDFQFNPEAEIRLIETELVKKDSLKIFHTVLNGSVDFYASHLVLYDIKTNEINVADFIYNEGFNPEFYKFLIGNDLSSKKKLKKFINDFEKLIQIVFSNVKFEQKYLGRNQTFFSVTYRLDRGLPKELGFIITLNHFEGILTSIEVYHLFRKLMGGKITIIE